MGRLKLDLVGWFLDIGGVWEVAPTTGMHDQLEEMTKGTARDELILAAQPSLARKDYHQAGDRWGTCLPPLRTANAASAGAGG